MTNLEAIQAMSSRYYCQPLDKVVTLEHEGKVFYPVGHNASHEFYLAADAQDMIWRLSVGEEWSEAKQEDMIKMTMRSCTGLDDIGYIGHW